MKNYIIFFILILVMAFSNYEISYSQNIETGDFYFLTGTVNDEEVILYLNIIGTNVFGYYNNIENSLEIKGFVDTYGKITISGILEKIDITGNLSDNGVFTGEIENIYTYEEEIDSTENNNYWGNLGTSYRVIREKTNTYKINLSLADTPINSVKISGERIRLSGQIGRGGNFKYKNIKYDFNNSKLNYIVNNSNNREDLKICYLDDKIIILYSEADGFSLNSFGHDFSKYMKKDGNTNYRDKNSGYPYYFVYSLDTYEEIDISDFIDFSAYNSLLSKIDILNSEFEFFNYLKPYTFSVKPNGNVIIGFYLDITEQMLANFESSEIEEYYELINDGWKFYYSAKFEIKRDNYYDSRNDFINMEMLKMILKKGSPLDYLFD